jgi:hypothetical protein
LQYWGRSNTHQQRFAIGLQFGQKFFNVAFCSYLHFQYFNWAAVPGGRISNPPTSQSPIVACNLTAVSIMTKHILTILFFAYGFCSCGQTKPNKHKNNVSNILPMAIELTKGIDTFSYFSILDTNFSKYQLPRLFSKPKKWLEADDDRKGMLGDWYGGSYPDTFDLQNALLLIDTAKDMSFGSAKSWCIKNYQIAFPYLIARLSDKRKIGLNNTADLIINDRIGSGDLKFYGHGGCITEDVFTVAGRASWILNQLTGEEFAVVHGNLTQVQSEKFKILWTDYISKLKK